PACRWGESRRRSLDTRRRRPVWSGRPTCLRSVQRRKDEKRIAKFVSPMLEIRRNPPGFVRNRRSQYIPPTGVYPMTLRRQASILSVCAAIALTPSAAPLAAQQQTGRIQGTVTDAATQRPLAGVQISVQGTGIGLITNDQGRYLLLNVPAGQHVVRATTIGYGSAQQTVTVVADETATVDFALSETAVALDEIVVTGTAAQVRRKEIGNSIATV